MKTKTSPKRRARTLHAGVSTAALAAALLLMGAGAPPGWGATVGVVNINTASAAELVLLPGVGVRRAAAIIATRQQRGGFERAEDLLDVEGIGAVMLEQMRSNVALKGSTTARRVSTRGGSARPLP